MNSSSRPELPVRTEITRGKLFFIPFSVKPLELWCWWGGGGGVNMPLTDVILTVFSKESSNCSSCMERQRRKALGGVGAAFTLQDGNVRG